MAPTSVPSQKSLANVLDKAAYTIDKAYLRCLKENFNILTIADNCLRTNEDNIRIIRVKRWVKDSEESLIDCFRNVLGTFSADSINNIALIIRRVPDNVEMYFALSNEGKFNNETSRNAAELLLSTLNGNFNGSDFEPIEGGAPTEQLIEKILPCKAGAENNIKSATVVTGIPTEKSKDFKSQGIEKLLEGIVPKDIEHSYTIVMLAEPLNPDKIHNILNGYEELASSLSPFVSNQLQISENTSKSKGENNCVSITKSVGEAINKTHSINVNVGVHIGHPNGIGGSIGAGYGYSNGKTNSTGEANTETNGTNYMITNGSNEGSTFTFKSYSVSDIIEKTEKNIKRIESGQVNGLWKYALYVLSPDSNTTRNVAGYISSIMCGEDSYIEKPYITEWSSYDEDKSDYNNIIKNLKQFTHPVFQNKIDATCVSATSYITTSELATMFAFPRHSVPGLPITECARFGREPYSLINLSSDIDIGCAYHMHHAENDRRIYLCKDELTKHTFITGSTGSGKSNAVYKLIEKLCLNDDNKDVNFMIIEPAKGEYKDILGGYKGVSVYGTNFRMFPNLLQINPFKFPDGVEVLEHVDRLVEVFNACWPMYAAMPAILREAVEQSYENCGWNLKFSVGCGKYPTFDDLLKVLPEVINSSEYSSDTSSDYKGALITRVRSLTRGIHGMIFNSDTPDEKLFNENVIIDISRIGSQETKALIMGILVMKLQEYRMNEGKEHNTKLRHITVLEEAHNLLRRTSNEQSQDSSNLQGKSVEMLASAIAEMRTYGEGFVIADQSPGLIDMSVIRNTNTKIILRLPAEEDRILVGRASGLNDEQIKELSRLRCGVAAVSQSDWLEPVLCNVDEFKEAKPFDKSKIKPITECIDSEIKAVGDMIKTALDIEHIELTGDSADLIRKWYRTKMVSEKATNLFENIISGNKLNENQKMLFVAYIIGHSFDNGIIENESEKEIANLMSAIYNITDKRVIDTINNLFLDTIIHNQKIERSVTPIEEGGNIV